MDARQGQGEQGQPGPAQQQRQPLARLDGVAEEPLREHREADRAAGERRPGPSEIGAIERAATWTSQADRGDAPAAANQGEAARRRAL